MSWIVVDVETDGPVISANSMICFGAVILDNKLDKTFYGQCKPEQNSTFIPDALAVSGFSREETLTFSDPVSTMREFKEWIELNNRSGRPTLISDNNGYDASWINYYFHHYIGENPFGWTSRRIGGLFGGHMKNPHYRWKKHRKTKHTHNPVDDCLGNAEALLWLHNNGLRLFK